MDRRIEVLADVCRMLQDAADGSGADPDMMWTAAWWARAELGEEAWYAGRVPDAVPWWTFTGADG